MSDRVQNPRKTRTVSVRIPGGDTEYWLTDQVFAEDDTLERHGKTWVVSEVLPPSQSGGHLTILLRATQP